MTDVLEGQMSIFDLGLQSGKTSPVPSAVTEEQTFRPSSKRSAKSQTPVFQFLCLKRESGRRLDASWEMATALPGVSMTLNFGEFPSEERESTLSQILEANAPEKYYLSARACAGILRRAEKRGKELPQMLKEALEEAVVLGEMSIAKCLDTSDGNPGKNQGGMCVVYDTTQITSPLNYSNPKPGNPCHPLAAQQHPPLAVCVGNGQLNQISMSEKSNTLDCMHDQQAVLTNGKHQRKYIVRRLTPLECCRLQGFPDWWEDGVEGSDSARYKMWGNGIALPCAVDVLRRVAKAVANET